MDLARYHRQMLLPGWGEAGQRRLAQSHALIVGCGALGCAAADSLCRAGVGTITIVDRDVVEVTNLQRQCLFDERDAREGTPKAIAAARRLGAINSGVRIRAAVLDFSPANALALLNGEPAGAVEQDAAASAAGRADVVIDATDNFETRLLINDLCVREGVAWVYGGVVGTGGVCMTILPRSTACLRCLMAHAPAPGSMPSCDTAGVLGPAVSTIAAWQSAEALKVLLGEFGAIVPGLRSIDLWTGRTTAVRVRADPDCACCARADYAFLRGDNSAFALSLCGRGAVQVSPAPGSAGAVSLREVANRLAPLGKAVAGAYTVRAVLRDERAEAGTGVERVELTVFADGRAIVKGVTTAERARAIYSRYLGG